MGTPTPSAISSMTTTAQGQVTGGSGDVGHHIYEVAFTDAKGDRHTAMSVANGSDEYSMGDFVKVSYDPANPDGGCRIERATIRVDGLIEQAERGSSSGTDGDRQSGKPSSGTTLAQRFLEREVDDDGDGDILSELSHLGRE